jgi:hypothetical protein
MPSFYHKLFFTITVLGFVDAIIVSKTSSTQLFASDPTALFNADILRIASRTATKKSNFNPVHAANHSHRMMVQMLEMYQKSEKKTARPNTETFRIVLKAYSNLGGRKWEDGSETGDQNYQMAVNAVDKMESVLIRWKDFESKEGNDYEKQLDTDVLNLILKAYARCGHQEIPLPSIQKDVKNVTKLPWFDKFSTRLSYAECAEKLLVYMKEHEEDLPNIAPDEKSYAYVIEAWSRQQPSARKYLKEMYGKDLNANDVCVIRASRWLSFIESFYKRALNGDIVKRRLIRRTLLWSYSDVLDAWARSGVEQAAKQATRCITRIEELSRDDVSDVNLAKKLVSSDECNELKHESWEYKNQNSFDHQNIELFHGKEKFLSPFRVIYPSEQSYTSAILALSRSTEKDAALRAHELLNRMLELYDSGKWGSNRPTLLAFNTVISAYAKSSAIGSADKAEGILNQLEDLCFGKENFRYKFLRPDVVTYNSVVTAWSNSKEAAAVYNAENIVKRMEKRCNAVDDTFLDVQPDPYTYSSLINSWIRSGLGVTSAEKAEELLRNMIQKYYSGDKKFLPNQKIFSQVIHAWGRCSTEAEFPVMRAMELLHLMEKISREGADELKPDIVTYSSLIDTIAKTRVNNSFELALDLLSRIESLYKAGDKSMKPNARTYSSVFNCLLYSEQQNKYLMAEKLLNRMKKIGVEPNSFTYNYAINCAASETLKDEALKMEAFKVALKAFTSLRRSNFATDCYTYNFFLKACTLLPSSSIRQKIVIEAFKECCDQGKLSNEALSRLQYCLDPASLRTLLQCDTLSVHDLNPRWSARAG